MGKFSNLINVASFKVKLGFIAILLLLPINSFALEVQYDATDISSRTKMDCEVSGVVLGSPKRTICKLEVLRGAITKDNISVKLDYYQDPEVQFFGKFYSVLRGACRGKPQVKITYCEGTQ